MRDTSLTRAPMRDDTGMLLLFAVLFPTFLLVFLALPVFALRIASGWDMPVLEITAFVIGAAQYIAFGPDAWPFGSAGHNYYMWSISTHQLSQFNAIVVYTITSIPVSLLLSAYIAYRMTTIGPPIKHIRGRIALSGREAIQKAQQLFASETKRSAPGLLLHPDLQLSAERETQHINIIGGTGAGKTTILYPMMQQAQQQNAKCVIYDFKGEFTACFPGLIFAPWDSRGVAWDIATDIQNYSDAETFACAMVKESNDPQWSSGARQLLIGSILYLMREHPRAWSLRDICNVIAWPLDVLCEIFKEIHPPAAAMLDQGGRTSESYHKTVNCFVAELTALAQGWENKPLVSLREWCFNATQGEASTLIMQSSSRYSELSKKYCRAILDCLSSILNSPETPESRTRRIWLFLDEFPQIGKTPHVQQFLEVGRSKGVRVILGMQSTSQLAEIYGKEVEKIYTGIVGTTIICRITGDTAKDVADKIIGKRRIARWSESKSQDFEVSKRNISGQYIEEDEYIYSPDELSAELGACDAGIRALLIPGGCNYVFEITWPFAQKSEIRPAVVMSDISTPVDPPTIIVDGGGVGMTDTPAPEPAQDQPEAVESPFSEPEPDSTLVADPTTFDEPAPADPEPEHESEDPIREPVVESLEIALESMGLPADAFNKTCEALDAALDTLRGADSRIERTYIPGTGPAQAQAEADESEEGR